MSLKSVRPGLFYHVSKGHRTRRGKEKRGQNVLAVLLDVGGLGVLETGTAARVFFASNADLLFGVAVLRRVLAFPSGVLLLRRKVDVNLLVSLGLRLGLAVLVRRREDAKGHGDAGFKVQIDDCFKRKRIFSYNLSWKGR